MGKVNHIIILVDTSYSMFNYINNVVISLNNFIKKLKEKEDSILITVGYFSNKISYITRYKNIKFVGNILPQEFIVYGSTALYDSICDVINNFSVINECYHTLFIISDGDDNVSTKYNREQANKMCEEVSKNNWKILHCNTDGSQLNVQSIIFDIKNPDDIESLFERLQI
jgi:uncharacterized protein YegL